MIGLGSTCGLAMGLLVGILHGVGLLELGAVFDVVTRLAALAAYIPLGWLVGCGGGVSASG